MSLPASRKGRCVTNRVDDDLLFRYLVEDEKRIRPRGETADDRIIRSNSNFGMIQQQGNDVLDALLNAPRRLWRSRGGVIEDRIEIGKCREGVA
jgi:hypothetical protein